MACNKQKNVVPPQPRAGKDITPDHDNLIGPDDTSVGTPSQLAVFTRHTLGGDNMDSATDEVRALNVAVGELYKVFARCYPLRSHIEGCPHCVGSDDDIALHSKPLRQLTAQELGRYAFKAMTTWGDDHDFRHFLPRLLELLAFDSQLAINPEILLGKLHYANWHSWPNVEQRSIEAYLKATWRVVLASYPSIPPYWDTDTGLCSIAQAIDDLGADLDYWRQDRSTAACHHLADFVNSNSPHVLKRRRLDNPFWHDRRLQEEQVVDWLLEPLTVQALEQAFFDHASGPFAQELSWAVDNLT